MTEIKYKAIALTLEKNIKANIYSEKLPPVRSLVAEFKVGNPTMNKALKILVQKGLIIPSGPRGNIISKKKVIRAKTWNVAVFYNTGNVDVRNNPLLKELSIKAEADNYKTLFMHALAPNVFDDDDFWSSNWVDGYIFVSSTLNKDLAYKLHNKSVPFVVANRLPPECGAHWVDFNLKKSLQTSLQRLIQAGRNRIMFAYSRMSLPSYVDYVKQVWNDTLREYSRECSGSLFYFAGHNNQKNSLECAEKFIEAKADALIIIGLSPLVIEAKLAAIGRQINQDYSLIYRSNTIEAPTDKFPHVLASYKALADETWSLFRKVVENPEIEAQNILVNEDIYLNKIIRKRDGINVQPVMHSAQYTLAEV